MSRWHFTYRGYCSVSSSVTTTTSHQSLCFRVKKDEVNEQVMSLESIWQRCNGILEMITVCCIATKVVATTIGLLLVSVGYANLKQKKIVIQNNFAFSSSLYLASPVYPKL